MNTDFFIIKLRKSRTKRAGIWKDVMKGERNPQKPQVWNYLLRGICLVWCHFGRRYGLERWSHVDVRKATKEGLGDRELWEERRQRGLWWVGCSLLWILWGILPISEGPWWGCQSQYLIPMKLVYDPGSSIRLFHEVSTCTLRHRGLPLQHFLSIFKSKFSIKFKLTENSKNSIYTELSLSFTQISILPNLFYHFLSLCPFPAYPILVYSNIIVYSCHNYYSIWE